MSFSKADEAVEMNLLSSGSCWQLAYLMLNAAQCLISQDIAPLTVFGEQILKTYFAALIPRLNSDTSFILSDVTFMNQLNNKALLFSLNVFF